MTTKWLIYSFLSVLSLSRESVAENVQLNLDDYNCAETDENRQCQVYAVSLINLIATPRMFDGKVVRIVGYLQIGREDTNLCLTEKSPSTDCLHLGLYDGDRFDESGLRDYHKRVDRIRRAMNGKQVIIRGRFDMSIRAFTIQGGIKEITRIDPW